MTRHLVCLAPAFALLLGCTRDAPTSPAPDPATAAAPAAVAAPAALTASAADALDAMDKRAPVPLLPMMAHHQKEQMRDHLVAVQEIVAALATDDFAGVEKAAGRIGFSDQEAQQCDHMGAGAPDFTKQALAFHHTADGIAAAARDKDRARVLAELGTTLQTCTACHATWKQQVVDAPTWQRVTGAPLPMGAAMGGMHGAMQRMHGGGH